MNIGVVGLWHLGTVTAACLASLGYHVIGLDSSADIVQKLGTGQAPVFEPGLEALLNNGLANGTLTFSSDFSELSKTDLIWITYDTPVDEEDRADVEGVLSYIRQLFPHVRAGALVLVSTQLPVGTTRRLELEYAAAFPAKPITFAYLPENLRLGKAIDVFLHPDRVVAGIRDSRSQAQLQRLLAPVTDRIEWMSVESAEMTKHALNVFLALSVTFANEIATLCESVGADAKEVERGLKSESRIGPKAYLGPGAAFSGGTLARDVQFLIGIGTKMRKPVPLLQAIPVSNDAHKEWAKNKLIETLGDLSGKTVAIWGLTYKPGTSTLRRSSAIELCLSLIELGAMVRAHDPAVKVLPPELPAEKITLCATAVEAIQNASALVIATAWPNYQEISANDICKAMLTPIIIDAGRFLSKTLGNDPHIRYLVVGSS